MLNHSSTIPQKVKKTGNKQNDKPKSSYHIKGIPLHAYLTETGDFKWIPTSQACVDKENAKTILDVLRKMPEDRRQVWASRLDVNEVRATCPIIKNQPDLCEQFDNLCNAYNPSKLRTAKEKKGGGKTNEETQ